MNVRIELMVVPGCPHHAAAAQLIATAVADTGVTATITQTVVTSEGQAQKRGFIGSPSFLLNGTDPFSQPGSPAALACRLYSTPDGPRGVPSLEDVRRALKRTAAG